MSGRLTLVFSYRPDGEDRFTMAGSLSLNDKKLPAAAEKPDAAMEFEVLYYKRTNKVHKTKGVSKADGILTVPQHPKHTGKITLYDADAFQEADESDESEDDSEEDTKKSWKKKKSQKQNKSRSGVIFSGVQVEISKRAPTLQEDDIVALGSYEVQILGIRSIKGTGQKTEAAASAPNALHKPLNTLHKPKKLFVATGLVRGVAGHPPRKAVPLQSKRAPIGVKKYVAPLVASNTPQSLDVDTPDDAPASIVPLRPKAVPQRRPLQSKSVLVSKDAAAKKVGGQFTSAKALGNKRTVTSQAGNISPHPQKPAKSPKLASTPSVLPEIPLPACLRQILRPHQVDGVDFLWKALTGTGTQGAILADEMGLGKTLMTIAIICAMHRRHRDKQFIVVCPSSLVSNWANEFDKWIGRASQPKRVVIKKGGEEGLRQIRAYFSSMKHQLSNKIGQVLIISYDLFRMNADQFQHLNTTVGLLVVDEGHRLKNTAGSATLTALESLQSDTRLCITATPIQNNLSEFYNLANFVCPGILGDLATFRRDYDRPISASNNKNASSDERTRGALQSLALEGIAKTFMLRRLQKEILKTMLPPRIEALLFCQPSERQCELYRAITSNSRVTGSFSDALVTLTTLRKLCSHPFLCKEGEHGGDDEDSTEAAQLSGKLVVLDALLQSIRETVPDDKVVIVSNFTSSLSIIEKLVLDPRQHSYQRLDGTTDLQNRQPMVDSFNRSTPEQNFCLLLSSKAGGCGLNLVGANRLVMFDPDWNPANDVQAMGRVYRQGQTKPCTIYRLFLRGTIEEVILQRQLQKGNLATLTVDGRGEQKSTGRFSKEEIIDCFTLKEDCNCDTKRKVGSHWAAYDGPESLRSQGCADDPLLDIAEKLSESLAFVHIVDDEEVASPPEGDPVDLGDIGSSESGEDSDSDDECEF